MGIIATAIISIAKYRAEIKRAYLEKIVDCAFKEWEWKNTQVIDGNFKKGIIIPFNYWLIFYDRFYKLLGKRVVTDKDINKFYKNYNIIKAALDEHAKSN